MNRSLLLIVLLLMSATVMAQMRNITGRVTDQETGESVPGASVLIKGTSKGTITDLDGNFKIATKDADVLVFSFVGYVSQEVPVGAKSVIDVSLSGDIEELAEVVVIGYGQIDKKDATGSVTSVSADDFNSGVIASPEQLFQGKAAGVQITSSSGEPGSGASIRIRGTSSVRNGNGPLYVVDGIPLTSSDISSGGLDLGRGTSGSSNPLNFINPNDIESINILKDASATAIYGSRGANGVIIIKTKSGKGIGADLTYTGSVSIANVARTFDLLNATQFLNGAEARGALRNELDFGANTDWQDAIFETGVSHKHNLSYGNSYKSGDYRVSLNYGLQDGVIDKSNLERITANLNLNQKLFSDKLTLGFRGTFSTVDNSQIPLSDNAGFEGDILAATYMANPTWAADPEVQNSTTNLNPLSYLKYSQDITNTKRALINVSAEYKIFKGLSFKVNGGFDRAAALRETVVSGDLLMGSRSVQGNGIGGRADWETQSDLIESFFTYDKEVGKSKFNAVIGHSYQQFRRNGTTNQAWGFNSTDLDQMVSDMTAAASMIRNSIDGSYQQWGYDSDGNPDDNILFINRLLPEPSVDINNEYVGPTAVRSLTEDTFNEVDELQSVFFRGQYSYDDKYIITGTVRADGSSKFGEDNQYGVFPSFGLAWRISEESFMPDAFDDFKFRAGWGVTGNQEIPHNLHQARQRYGDVSVGDGGQVAQPGLNTITFANPSLKWEQTVQTNFGLDFGFFHSRLNGSIDIYNKSTTNLLIKVVSAQPAPQPFFWTNLDAEVVNQGVELTLNYALFSGTDWNWDLGVNYAYNKNEVRNFVGSLNTGEIHGQGLTGAFVQRIADGQPLYAYYLREFGGFDENGNSVYIGGDQQRFLNKSPLPMHNLGLSTNASYKSWTMSVYAYGQFGQYIYNNTQNALFTAGALGNGRNVTSEVLTNGEAITNAPDVSTRFLEKGDFVRIQNIAISRNIGFEKGSFVQNIVVSLTAQNVFLITNYSGLDPEVNSNKSIDDIPSFGIEYSPYPRPRIFTLGVSAKF